MKHVHDRRWGVGQFFDRRATILEPTATQDTYGEPIRAWTILAGHADIPCAVGNGTLTPMQRDNREPTWEDTKVLLLGSFPEVTTIMRVMLDDEHVYEIGHTALAQRRFHTSSHLDEFTSLTVRRVH